MSSMVQPAEWKLRTLGAALGAGFSAVVGVLLIPTIGGLYLGIVGIPAGAIAGALYAPRLARVPKPARSVVRAAGVACLLGIGGHVVVLAGMWILSPSELGAPWYGVLAMAAFFGVAIFVQGVVLGFPMAIVVAAMATWAGRRAARNPDQAWPPAVGWAVVMSALSGLELARLLGWFGPL